MNAATSSVSFSNRCAWLSACTALFAACDSTSVEVAWKEKSFANQLADVQAGKSREIRIKQSMIGDEQLAQLEGLKNLERINLERGSFSDVGLAYLSELPGLTLLRFHSPNVTDGGMKHIARIRSLRFLHLIDVPITDAGLPPIQGMTQLESFYLDGGQVTDEALSALITARPDLHFHKDQLHLPGDPNADE